MGNNARAGMNGMGSFQNVFQPLEDKSNNQGQQRDFGQQQMNFNPSIQNTAPAANNFMQPQVEAPAANIGGGGGNQRMGGGAGQQHQGFLARHGLTQGLPKNRKPKGA